MILYKSEWNSLFSDFIYCVIEDGSLGCLTKLNSNKEYVGFFMNFGDGFVFVLGFTDFFLLLFFCSS